MRKKVVYNACYGGFSLSPLAVKKYYEEKYPEVELYFYSYDYSTYTYTKIPDIENYSGDDFSVNIFSKDLGDSFVHRFGEKNEDFDEGFMWVDYEISRHDPILVKVVEELGEKASGRCSRLTVKEIEGNAYRIDEYDGYESVIEPNNETWIFIDEDDNTGGE